MKKTMTGVLLSGMCLLLVLAFPQAGNTTGKVDDQVCLECHVVDFGSDFAQEQHVIHANADCGKCHSGSPSAGTVDAASCTACHLSKCDSVNAHDPGAGADCLSCHTECGDQEPTTTTTIPDDDDGEECVAARLYGPCSDEAGILRQYRDTVLQKTPEGRRLIALYYRLSPAVTRAMEKNRALEALIRARIDDMLPVIRTELQEAGQP